jgi:hypothetical protein
MGTRVVGPLFVFLITLKICLPQRMRKWISPLQRKYAYH